MFGGSAAAVDPRMVAGAAIQRHNMREKGLFGRKVKPSFRGDGVTMAHKGMPAVLQRDEKDMREGGASFRLGSVTNGDPTAIEQMQQQDLEQQRAEGLAAAKMLNQGQGASPARGWSVNADGETMGAGVDPMPARGDMAAQQGPLGGSMRQPFDYDAALKALQGERKDPKAWQIALAAIGDGLTQHSGGQPWAVQNLVAQRDANSERLLASAQQIAKWRYDDYQAQRDADLKASNPFTIGRDRVGYDPATGEARVLYDGGEDFELYAQELGLEEGTPEYFQAVEDYVLRSSGPSAHGRDMELDDYRTANDSRLENQRFGNRRAMEVLRQGNRRGMVDYRNANPPPSRSRAPAKHTARDANGNVVEWNGKAWVPAK